MGTSIKVKVGSTEAVYQATKSIEKYTEATQRRIRSVIKDGTMAIYDSAVRMAPVATGALKQGIRFKAINDWQAGEVVSTAPSSFMVENGTGPRMTYPNPKKGRRHAMKLPDGRFVKGDIYNGKMKAHPFMRPAYMENKDKIETAMKEALAHDSD